ncbi:MAG: type II toxin-antitoxin system HicA family toxin [Planctomycetia bacterium]|nr:type II toxin-antitoxin system HicA family toxin [Planctomycetia bacterium]
MKYREVAERLVTLGCHELPRRGGGSHRKWINPATQRATVLPDWGGKDLKLGTVRSAVRQLGLEWQAFQDL